MTPSHGVEVPHPPMGLREEEEKLQLLCTCVTELWAQEMRSAAGLPNREGRWCRGWGRWLCRGAREHSHSCSLIRSRSQALLRLPLFFKILKNSVSQSRKPRATPSCSHSLSNHRGPARCQAVGVWGQQRGPPKIIKYHSSNRRHGSGARQEAPGQRWDGVDSPGTLGAPKEGQLVWGEVSIEEGEALQDAVHQALGRAVLPAASAGL